MSMLFPLVLVVMMVGIFASMLREGLWSSLLTLMNTLLAALLATNFFEALATLMTKYVPSGTMFWDIVAVWGIFALAFLVLRAATDQLSKVRVRFKRPIDLAGGYFFAIWTAYVMIAFTTMTLHTAPLGRNFMWGGFKAEDPIFFGLKPDRQWLGFVQLLSQGSLSRVVDENNPEAHVFDPKGMFMPNYATRRDQYERDDSFTAVQ